MMMQRTLKVAIVALWSLLVATPLAAQITNGGFETGDFSGWTADANWTIAQDSRGYYSGWQGKCWAWSGGQGEPATGKLKSKPFVLDRDGVRLSIAGWNSHEGSGKPRKWNYVTLNLADGTELDRVWAPNTTTFVSVMLSGVGHRGQSVYIEAVDDADQATYSMLCIDAVQTVSSPLLHPLPPLPRTDPASSLVHEDERYLVEVTRSNGTIARVLDKQGGIELIREPRLADNFRFTLPIPGKESWETIEANYLWGNQQKLSSFRSDGKRLTLRWDKPMVNYLGEKFDASAAMNVELTKDGILFSLTIDNASPYPIGEVFFPIIGGVQGIGKNGLQLKSTELVRPVNENATAADNVFRVFNSMPAGMALGDQGPEQFYSYAKGSEAWATLFSPRLNRSICLAVREPRDCPIVLRLELLPGSSGTTREDGNWPRPEELKGQPVGVSACFADFPNAPPGKKYKAPSVLISACDGDRHAARNTSEKAGR
jgi:hypothetical protein